MTDAIPAASLIVLRDGGDGLEVLMVERAAALAFAAGALVFPGGRVDAGDRAIAARIGGEPDDMAARVAAIRETIEEAGLTIGAPPELRRHRRALLAGEAVETLLPATALDLDALTPFARWRPDGMPHRFFDTRFYLARLPGGAGEAAADGSENVRAIWVRPAAAPEGAARLVFPTRRILERLALHADVASALADAGAWPERTIVPRIEDRGGVPHLCIPSGMGYPVIAEPLATAMRV